MKKILRAACRMLIVLLMLMVNIEVIMKLGENKTVPFLISTVAMSLLTGITILVSVILLLNPTAKFSSNRKIKIRKNEKTKEFIRMCEQLNRESGEKLEIYRKKAILCLLLMFLSFVLVFITAIVYMNFEFSLTIGIILTLILVGLYMKNKKDFDREFKQRIMQRLIKNINPTLEYDYFGGKNIFQSYYSTFPDQEEYNGYETTDYIHGKMSGIDLAMCKISLLNYSKKTGEKINTVETFLFSKNKINFSSPSKVMIKPNNYFNAHKRDRIQMDSSKFEKYFDVFSDSDIVAMQILTHDVMEELFLFYLEYRCKFEIIVKDNNLLIKFLTGDVFNPKVLKKVTDSNLLLTYYSVLNFVTRLCVRINKSLDGKEI